LKKLVFYEFFDELKIYFVLDEKFVSKTHYPRGRNRK